MSGEQNFGQRGAESTPIGMLMEMFRQHREDTSRALDSQRTDTERRFGQVAEHMGELTRQVGKLADVLARREGSHAALDKWRHYTALVVASIIGAILSHFLGPAI